MYVTKTQELRYIDHRQQVSASKFANSQGMRRSAPKCIFGNVENDTYALLDVLVYHYLTFIALLPHFDRQLPQTPAQSLPQYTFVSNLLRLLLTLWS